MTWTKDLTLSISGLTKESHQHIGFQDFSSHRLSSLVLSKTMQESMWLPLINCLLSTKFMMKLSQLTLLNLQKTVCSSMDSILKELDGIKQSTWLTILNQRYCMLKCHWSGMYQRRIERSPSQEYTNYLFTRFSQELVLCLPQVTQLTLFIMLRFQPKKIQRIG